MKCAVAATTTNPWYNQMRKSLSKINHKTIDAIWRSPALHYARCMPPCASWLTSPRAVPVFRKSCTWRRSTNGQRSRRCAPDDDWSTVASKQCARELNGGGGVPARSIRRNLDIGNRPVQISASPRWMWWRLRHLYRQVSFLWSSDRSSSCRQLNCRVVQLTSHYGGL